MLFVSQPSVLCDSTAYTDSNETSNILCTLLRLTCRHGYFSFPLYRSQHCIANNSQIFTGFIKQSGVMFSCVTGNDCRSQWPRGLRRRSAAARLLRLWVRIPPGAWMFVVLCVVR